MIDIFFQTRFKRLLNVKYKISTLIILTLTSNEDIWMARLLMRIYEIKGTRVFIKHDLGHGNGHFVGDRKVILPPTTIILL